MKAESVGAKTVNVFGPRKAVFVTKRRRFRIRRLCKSEKVAQTILLNSFSLGFLITCERLLQARRVQQSEERGEPPLTIGLQGLHQISDWKREHDPVDGVGDTLRNLDVPFVGCDTRSVYRRYLFANNAKLQMKRNDRDDMNDLNVMYIIYLMYNILNERIPENIIMILLHILRYNSWCITEKFKILNRIIRIELLERCLYNFLKCLLIKF